MKQLLFQITRISQHCKHFLQALLHEGNHFCSHILPQKKLPEHDSQLLVSNAIDTEHLEKSENTQLGPHISKFVLENNNKDTTSKKCRKPNNNDESVELFETYLCNYRYEGKVYSVEICATSFEDANARRRSLQHGQIIGVLRMNIPVNESCYLAVSRFFKSLFVRI